MNRKLLSELTVNLLGTRETAAELKFLALSTWTPDKPHAFLACRLAPCARGIIWRQGLLGNSADIRMILASEQKREKTRSEIKDYVKTKWKNHF